MAPAGSGHFTKFHPLMVAF